MCEKSFWILSLPSNIPAILIIHDILRFNEDTLSFVLQVIKEAGAAVMNSRRCLALKMLWGTACHLGGPAKSAGEEIIGCRKTSGSFSLVRPCWGFVFFRRRKMEKKKKRKVTDTHSRKSLNAPNPRTNWIWRQTHESILSCSVVNVA